MDDAPYDVAGDHTAKPVPHDCKHIGTDESSFIYKTLDDASQIRLLQILAPKSTSRAHTLSLSIRFYDKNKAPSYTALSYSWGSDRRDKLVLLNGRRFYVTRSLHTFLIEARRRIATGRWTCDQWWVDAVCINQGDDEEKSAQVAQMKTIYENASTIVLWLGYHRRYYRNAQYALDTLLQNSNSGATSGTSKIHYRALKKVSASRWWNRVWTFQEATTPSERVEFWFGPCAISFNDYMKAEAKYSSIQSTTSRSSWHSSVDMLDEHEKLRTQLANVRVLGTTRERRANSERSELWHLLEGCRGRNCSDPRDKVFAVLSLCTGGGVPAPDYTKSTLEVFLSVVTYYIESHGRLMLSTAPFPIDHTDDPNFPGWLVDWSRKDPMKGHQQVYSADRRRRAEASILEGGSVLRARGLVVDRVRRTSAGRPRGMQPVEWGATFASWTANSRAEQMSRRAALGHVLCADVACATQQRGHQVELQRYWTAIDLAAQADVCHYLGKHSADRHRVLLVTEGGLLGAGMNCVKDEDLVVVLFGAQTPVVLRALGDRHVYLGETYVHGIMDGEAFNGRDVDAEAEFFDLV